MSAVVNVGQFFRAAVTPQPDTLTSISPPGGDRARVVTFDVNADQKPSAIEQKDLADGAEIQGADEGTNDNVAAGESGTDRVAGIQHRPGLFGADSESGTGAGAGVTSVRQGIRDGIRGFRKGVRAAVKTLTGRGANGGRAGESADESPSQRIHRIRQGDRETPDSSAFISG
jgi:hypothetical protein